jgi:HPt (histidine-containing phosphotransfer) domain-containing protein
MYINWDTTYIDPQNLIAISRGDKNRMLKYLNQFQELIPQRIENLKEHLQTEDRKKIRQILHQMSPQLQFFGIPEVVDPIRALELEYETMPIEDLKSLVTDILIKLDHASKEVEQVLKNHFE